ncbi:MAG: DUF2934 domain-containing protein [Devosia sp.]
MSEHDPWVDPAFEQAVRETAYFLWEQDGRPEGREQEYWFRALERSLRERGADAAIAAAPRQTQQVDDTQDDLGRPVNSSAAHPGGSA